MTQNKNFIYPLVIFLSSLWFGWTVLVDFFVIKSIFSHVDIFFKAGALGMELFNKLNNLEVIIGTFLTALLAWEIRRNQKIKIEFILGILCWIIAMVYFSFLTPKLVYLTELWERTDLMGITKIAGIEDIQQEHQYYHKIYVFIDSLKLFFLSSFILLCVSKQEKWF